MDAEQIGHWIESLALLTTLAVAFGIVKRALPGRASARLVLGLLFGLAASWQMLTPIEFAPGVLVDMRSIPVAMAAAFLGVEGMVACLAVAIVTRLAIGGAGTISGLVGIAIFAAAGRAWLWRLGLHSRHSLHQLVLLGLVSSAGFASYLLLPDGMGLRLLATHLPFLLPLHILGAVAVGWAIDRERLLIRQVATLERQSARDPLTGVLNRRGFAAEVAAAGSGSAGSALLLLDIDRFKMINDSHGHAAGDRALAHVTRIAESVAGRTGIVGRLGGDEIAIYLPSVRAAEASAAAARLCDHVAGLPVALDSGPALALTVSVGLDWSPDWEPLDRRLHRADAAMYAAKTAGRNRFAIHPGARAA